MSKNITFKKEDIICITLNMSNAHIEFLCDRYNLDYSVISDFKNRKIKYVYIDIKNLFIVAHLFNNNICVHVPYTTKINTVTLESIKQILTILLKLILKKKKIIGCGGQFQKIKVSL